MSVVQGHERDLMVMTIVEVGPGLPLDADSDILDRPGKEALRRAKEAAS